MRCTFFLQIYHFGYTQFFCFDDPLTHIFMYMHVQRALLRHDFAYMPVQSMTIKRNGVLARLG